MLMHVNACQCMPMHANACQRMPIHANACQCIPMHDNACQCIPMHANACHYAPVHVNECGCMRMRANACQCMPMHANACQCMPIMPWWALRRSCTVLHAQQVGQGSILAPHAHVGLERRTCIASAARKKRRQMHSIPSVQDSHRACNTCGLTAVMPREWSYRRSNARRSYKRPAQKS